MARRKSSNFISGAIKRPGALSGRAKRKGRSVSAQANYDKQHGTPLQKRQANFYTNVLKKSSSGGGSKKRRSHVVKKHTRTLASGKKVPVKRHRRSKKKG